MRSIRRIGALQRKERSPGMFKRFWNDESGQDLVETILIILIMALVVWAVFPAIGSAIRRAGDRIVEVINRVIGYNP
jgi:Flp pilus assembly pilin Flp